MALGSAEPLTEMSTWDITEGGGVKSGRRVMLTNSPPSMSQMSRENVGISMSHNPMGLHGLLQKELFTPDLFGYCKINPVI
jgi:hypothetical protein